MHKKYYFAGAFIFTGIAMGVLSFFGLNQTGFNNKGPVPISAVLGVSGAFVLGGLLFIILGGSKKSK